MQGLFSYLRGKPLQRRVTVWTTILVALAIILSNVAGFVALQITIVRASQGIALSIAQDVRPAAAQEVRLNSSLGDDVRQAAGVIVEAVNPAGAVIRLPGETQQIVLDRADLDAASPGAPPSQRTGVDAGGQPYVIVAVPLEDTGYALVVARPLAPVLGILAVQRLILFVVCGISVLAAAVVTGFVARSALRPVRQLTAAVQHVTDTKDFQPISINYGRGDLSVLSASFNQLLRTLAQSRERQSRLIADAGHELRTPLTSLSTNVDLLNADLRSGQLTIRQRGEIMTDVRAQLTELNELVGDLVQLARDDSRGSFRPLDVRDVVNSAVERVRRRAQDRVIAVDLSELYLVGDPDSLERAVTNLLDNAVKWSPAGSTIRVRLEGNRLRVADSGPGIPEQDVPYVFDRFFRGETARKTHGTGLGLSIVAKSVEDHGGSVRAGRSDDGGAEFTIRLPGVTSREALPQLLVAAG